MAVVFVWLVPFFVFLIGHTCYKKANRKAKKPSKRNPVFVRARHLRTHTHIHPYTHKDPPRTRALNTQRGKWLIPLTARRRSTGTTSSPAALLMPSQKVNHREQRERVCVCVLCLLASSNLRLSIACCHLSSHLEVMRYRFPFTTACVRTCESSIDWPV